MANVVINGAGPDVDRWRAIVTSEALVEEIVVEVTTGDTVEGAVEVGLEMTIVFR